jgi:hypothetical protein
MSQAPEPKRRGRPPLPADQRVQPRSFRLSPSAIEKLAKLAEYSGLSQTAWVERQIERARLP